MPISRNVKTQVVIQGKDEASGTFQRVESSASRYAGAITAAGTATTALSAIVAKGIKVFAAWEKKIAEVSTLVDTAAFDMQGLATTTKDLAGEFGVDATQQAGAFYQAISAGATDAATATEVVTQANKLALGGVTTLDNAIDGLTTVMNAYGLEQKDLAGVSDSFFAAMRLGKTTVGELSASVGNVAKVANIAGVEINELFAALSVLTRNGVKTNKATIFLRQAINALLKPSNDARKVAKQLGIQFDAAALRAKGLFGVLQDIQRAGGANAETMTRLFGNIRGFSAVAVLAAEKSEQFANDLEAQANKAGESDVAVGKMNKTLDFKYNQISAKFDTLTSSLGQAATRALELHGAMALLNEALNERVFTSQEILDRAESVGIWAAAWEHLSRKIGLTTNALIKAEALPIEPQGPMLGPEVPAGHFPQPAPKKEGTGFRPEGGIQKLSDEELSALRTAQAKAQRQRDKETADHFISQQARSMQEVLRLQREFEKERANLSFDTQRKIEDHISEEAIRLHTTELEEYRKKEEAKLELDQFYADRRSAIRQAEAEAARALEIALNEERFQQEVARFDERKELEKKARKDQERFLTDVGTMAGQTITQITNASISGAESVEQAVVRSIKAQVPALIARGVAEAFNSQVGIPVVGPILGAAAAAAAAGFLASTLSFHSGGDITETTPGRIPGLRPDERLIVGQVGERVVARSELAGRSGSEGGTTRIESRFLGPMSRAQYRRVLRDVVAPEHDRLRRSGVEI